jgi:hypothetical protein
MKTSIWYHTADRQPNTSGYYIGFRTVTLADDTCGVDYFYYNKSADNWSTDNTSHSHWANVYYWTESDPEAWVDADPPVRYRKSSKSNPALEIAWNKVEDAIRNYELIKALSSEVSRED